MGLTVPTVPTAPTANRPQESYWKALLARQLYSGASDGASASLSHLVGLYVERSGELWKPPELLALLRGAAEEAADVAEGKVGA